MFPEAAIHFMHPVKSRGAIREAWSQHGVRDFVLDTDGELAKILAGDRRRRGELGLVVRLALPKGDAAYDLSGKFGAAPEEAAALLRAARPHAARLGLSFHVGSQCLDPPAWTRALALAARGDRARPAWRSRSSMSAAASRSPIRAATPPPLGAFMAEIARGRGAAARRRARCGPSRAARWWPAAPRSWCRCRRGRGDALYVNDGVYGALSDAGAPGFRFPLRLIRAGRRRRSRR